MNRTISLVQQERETQGCGKDGVRRLQGGVIDAVTLLQVPTFFGVPMAVGIQRPA